MHLNRWRSLKTVSIKQRQKLKTYINLWVEEFYSSYGILMYRLESNDLCLKRIFKFRKQSRWCFMVFYKEKLSQFHEPPFNSKILRWFLEISRLVFQFLSETVADNVDVHISYKTVLNASALLLAKNSKAQNTKR